MVGIRRVDKAGTHLSSINCMPYVLENSKTRWRFSKVFILSKSRLKQVWDVSIKDITFTLY